MDLRLEYESFRVYEQVALRALDLLAAIVTTLFFAAAHRGTLERLAIHHASAGLRISVCSGEP